MFGLLACLMIGVTLLPASAQPPRLIDDVPNQTYDLISDFITQTYLSGFIEENDLYNIYYAPRLEKYWKKRNVSIGQVIADKKRHFKRWPYTNYRLISDSLDILRISGQKNSYAIQFKYDFEAIRKEQVRSGQGSSQLLIRIVDGVPVIYRETGRVLKRY